MGWSTWINWNAFERVAEVDDIIFTDLYADEERPSDRYLGGLDATRTLPGRAHTPGDGVPITQVFTPNSVKEAWLTTLAGGGWGQAESIPTRYLRLWTRLLQVGGCLVEHGRLHG